MKNFYCKPGSECKLNSWFEAQLVWAYELNSVVVGSN